MKQIFVPYVNPYTNRESFPSDEVLKRLDAVELERMPEHEVVIAHALLANYVYSVKLNNGQYMATIFSNLVVLPESGKDISSMLINLYTKTSAMIKSLLSNIPGFKVDIVSMNPDDIPKWMQDFKEATLLNTPGKELYSTMKSGIWYIQYSWTNPFSIDTSLTAWDVASNYLYDSIQNNIYHEGYQGLEGLQKMMELDLLKVEQHPYSKGSFLVCFRKQLGDHLFAPCLTWFGGHSQVWECGKNDMGLTTLFLVTNNDYIGSWYAIKEDMNSGYARLKT